MFNSITQQPICKNGLSNERVRSNGSQSDQYTQSGPASRTNLSEIRNLSPEYVKMTQCQTTDSCYASTGQSTHLADISRCTNNSPPPADFSLLEENLSNFDTWQASMTANSQDYGDNLLTPDMLMTKGGDKVMGMSFQKLLALADAQGNKIAIQNALLEENFAVEGEQMEFGTPSSSFCGSRFHPPTKGDWYNRSYENSRPDGHAQSLGQSISLEASIGAGASLIPSRPSSDLNTTLRMNAEAAYGRSILFQFEPRTPQKSNRAEYNQQKFPVIDLTIDEVPTGKDAQNEVEKLKSFFIIDQSYSAMSTQLQENHQLDKGGMYEPDLAKTPEKKVRRKKHRPKVIIEGQKKSTPKGTKKSTGPQESTSVKRKYIQRKGVANPLGGDTDAVDLNKKESSSLATPTGKRKYVRRKGVTKPEDNVHKETRKTADLKASRITRRSCRQTLTFNSDGQVGGQSSVQCASLGCDEEPQAENLNAQDQSITSECRQEMTKKDDVTNPSELTQFMDQVQKNKVVGYHTEPTRGKCQIVFSDVTHDKDTNTVEPTMTSNGQRAPRSLCESVSSGTCQAPERQVGGLKRQKASGSVESEISYSNEMSKYFDFLQAYLPIFSQNVDNNNAPPGLHFPINYKRKRIDKGYSTLTSSSELEIHVLRDSGTNKITSVANHGLSCGPCDIGNLLKTNPANDSPQTALKVYEDLLALGPRERIRKKRSNGSTRLRDLASLQEICRQLPASTSQATATQSRMEQMIAILHEPPSCREALVADNLRVLKTKKRKKRSLLANSPVQRFNNDQKFAAISMESPLALTWRTISPVDSIMEQLNQLDLNATSKKSEEKWNAFVANHSHHQELSALVPFQRSGPLIPFDGSFDAVRRRRPRPKVNLDDETTRVWKLLLENINSEGIDGTDEEKTKWWEEERRVFNGRADSFIARMHLVQGTCSVIRSLSNMSE